MKAETHIPFLSTFAVYTVFGYLSLVLHHAVFYPNRGEQASDFGMLVMLANLMAGGWCFWKAIRVSRDWWRSL